MDTYIVRQPILDRKQNVVAYEILYQQDESSLYGKTDITVANAIEDFLVQVNSERFLEGHTAYLTFTPNLLLRNIPKMFSVEKLVVQIEDNVIVHPLAHKVVYRLHKQGYRIAIKGFEFSPRYFGIMDVVDIIKVDLADLNNTSLKNIVNIGLSLQKEIVAYNVDTPEAFELAKQLGCHYVQGTYVAHRSTSKVQRLDHMQGNFFRLMVAVTKDEPDIDEIAEIISRDVTLAFSLIKIVNSAYFALRNRATSVKQALIILGLGQLKQWIYLLSFKKDMDRSVETLIKTSFLRASFCSELSVHVPNLPISKSEAYLLGMFSTLGTLLDVSLQTALEELPISDEIKKALIEGTGLCGVLYHMVLYYEKADWRGITECARQLGIEIPVITRTYFECVEHVNIIWRDLTVPYEASTNPEEEEIDEQEFANV